MYPRLQLIILTQITAPILMTCIWYVCDFRKPTEFFNHISQNSVVQAIPAQLGLLLLSKLTKSGKVYILCINYKNWDTPSSLLQIL